MGKWRIVSACEDDEFLRIPAHTKFEKALDLLIGVWLITGVGVSTLEFWTPVFTIGFAVGVLLVVFRFFFDEYYVADTSGKVFSLRRDFGLYSSDSNRYSFEDLAALVIEKTVTRHSKTQEVQGEQHEVLLLTKANERIPLLFSLFKGSMDARVDARKLAPILGIELVEGDLNQEAVFVPDVAGVPRVSWRESL